MNLLELKDRFYWSNVPERWYSINDGLKPDAWILFENYSKWEFFYLDEKGKRHDFRVFEKQEDAYKYLWQKVEEQLEVFKVKPRERQR